MRPLLWIPAAVVALAATTVACGTGGDPGAPATTATQAATPPDDQLDLGATVDVRLILEPVSLNPFATSGVAVDQLLLDNVYEGLVSADTADGDKIVPRLATSHEVSPDGLSYTFTLTPDAKFHDGSALTSADVVWSLQQQIAPGSKGLRAAEFASVAAVSAPDPTTVKVDLKQRDTFLLWNLTQRGGIVYKKDTDFATLDAEENGSGPYTIANWNRGADITLARNDAYWGAKPKNAKVVLHYIPEPSAANNAQTTGQTDVQTAADATLLQPFTANPGFTVLRGTTTDKFTLALNNKRAPFDNPDVRHAFRQAINKEDVIAAYGAGIPIGGPVPPQDPWYTDLTGTDAHNPEGAKALLAKAGHAGGLAVTLDIPNVYPRAIADVLVSNLKQVGVTLTVRQVEFPTWLTRVFTNHDYELSIVDHAEARDIGNYAKPDYYFGYDNKQVQADYAAARAAASDGERDELLRKVAKQASDDAATDWLFVNQTHTVVRTGVYGVPSAETTNRFPLSGIAVGK
ncbi:ABC transporter substrate-binding protein [Actinokineospora spheciospongiae]|uniref:ABC transporter substrate-binding protein n=1 Tax=Actinokineospora spheciospongiae TaxID=909613 RepID=UPI000D71B423|nr:ABC transporter substrate-binding protein [Actinokineospora spheciospongiae]PWW62748.1 peptide/nickel transport system substrate-binding protein [Actinokineospora spheciospongiae]